MPEIYVRSLIGTGNGGIVVSVPPGWLRFHELKAGDKVEILIDGKIVIRPVPKGTPKDARP